jgi:phenylacetate-CoA ligase
VLLRVERADTNDETLAESLGAALRNKLNVRFDMEVLNPGTLPRTVHKAKRLLRE